MRSKRLSCALIEFQPAQFFLENRRPEVFSRLTRGDDSREELKKTFMRANSQQLSSSFCLRGFIQFEGEEVGFLVGLCQ